MARYLSDAQYQRLNWEKGGDLLAAVVQHALDGRVLMLGYMNPEALIATESSGLLHFYSRSRQRLWQKGESSGHSLRVERIELDCDGDALLVQAQPIGPTCHRGTRSCFDAENEAQKQPPLAFLAYLEQLIAGRQHQAPESSYTARLWAAGVARIAQKVAEEGVEVALAAVQGLPSQTLDESADLIYHLLVLLQQQKLSFTQVMERLQQRHQLKAH